MEPQTIDGVIEKPMNHDVKPSGPVFEKRESILTSIYHTPGGKVLYSWTLAAVIITFTLEVIRCISDPEILMQDLSHIMRIFSSIHIFVFVWFAIHVPIFAILYPSIKFHLSHPLSLFLPSVISTVFLIISIPILVVSQSETTEVVRFIIGLEQVRILMKVIAFSTEVSREGDSMDEKKKSSLHTLVYFLFAPTLVYKTSYPKLDRDRDYKIILKHVVEVAVVAFVGYIVYRRHYEPLIMTIGAEPLSHMSIHDIISIIKWSTIMGALFLTGIGLGFLHSCLNIWAELLDFGDRQFYKSWWECRGIEEFMRTWNFLIHNWISQYLYKPTMILTNNKTIGLLTVIIVSAFIHDYIMSFAGGIAASPFSSVVIFVVIPTFIFSGLANYIQSKTDLNVFTFLVLGLTSLVIGLIGGSEYATRVVNCVDPKRKPYNIMLGIFDCKF